MASPILDNQTVNHNMNDEAVQSCDLNIDLPRLRKEILGIWDTHTYGNNQQWKKIHLVDCFDRRDMSQPPEWAEIKTPRSIQFHKRLRLEDYVFSPNANMNQCPYLKELLTKITSDTSRIYMCDISILKAGGKVGTHKDDVVRPYMRNEDRWKRFHIPIITNPDSVFIIQNRTYSLKEGILYKLRTTYPHRVANLSGSEDRYHLIIDLDPGYIFPDLKWSSVAHTSRYLVAHRYLKRLFRTAKCS